MHKRKEPVRFRLNGITGNVDENNWVLYGNCGFHLEDITDDSEIKKVIEKAREKEKRK